MWSSSFGVQPVQARECLSPIKRANYVLHERRRVECSHTHPLKHSKVRVWDQEGKWGQAEVDIELTLRVILLLNIPLSDSRRFRTMASSSGDRGGNKRLSRPFCPASHLPSNLPILPKISRIIAFFLLGPRHTQHHARTI